MKRKPDVMSVVLILAATLVILLQTSCRERRQDGSNILAYEDNGVVWGWGNMRIGSAAPSIAVYLDRLPVTGPNGQQFKLLVADKESGAKTDLFYADWHPDAQPPVPVVFASRFFLQNRAGARGVVDVYVKLQKAGKTWPKDLTLAVGTADTSAARAGRYPVVLANGIRLSAIVAGEQAGAVVFHYADLPVTRIQSGAIPGVQEPPPPERLVADGFSPLTVAGTQQLGLPTGAQGKLTFVSARVRGPQAEQPRLCHDRFYAVARTAGKRVNASCQLKIAPVSEVPAAGDWLTCSVFVQFRPPVRESEKLCVVLATFQAGDDSLDQLTATVRHSGDQSGEQP